MVGRLGRVHGPGIASIAAPSTPWAHNYRRIPLTPWNEHVDVKALLDADHGPGAAGVMAGMARIRHLAEHQHLASEIYLVVGGEGRMQLGDQWINLRPGTFVYLPSGIRHQVRAGSKPVEIVYFFPRNGLVDVSYDFDLVLRQPQQAAQVGRLPAREGLQQERRILVRGEEPTERGLGMELLRPGPRRPLRVEATAEPRILLVQDGRGGASVGQKSFPLERGSYVYVPPKTELVLKPSASLKAVLVHALPPAADFGTGSKRKLPRPARQPPK
jgi:quercetin dioxygenase-like cupin family protein